MAAAMESDMSFLDRQPVGQVRLIFNLPDGSRHVIQNLNLPLIKCQSSLLNFAFECSTNGTPAADIDVPSVAAGIALVRFIYTKNYGWPSSQHDVSLLLTAHVFALGHKVDYEELYHEAHVILLRKVNFAADYSSPPSDLSATIRFLWTQTWVTKELSSIKGDIVNYCVTAFERHKLGSNPDFIKLSQEHVNFHMDLSWTNRERNFEQGGILQLPGPDRSPPPRPFEEDICIACAFSSHGDEDSIDLDDDIYSTDGTISEDEEDDCEDFCANDAVSDDDEGDGEDLCTNGTISEVEGDGKDFCVNGTISKVEEGDGEGFSCANDVMPEDEEEGKGEHFSYPTDVISEDGEEGKGEDFSSADGTISEDDDGDGEGDEDDEGDEQPALLFHLPMRPKPNSHADTEFVTAPASPTSEASFVVVYDSVQSTLDSESDSESEWQML